MTNAVKAWVDTVVLPTYRVGNTDTNPLFLEKRVYQGSSGNVYPYGVIDKLLDEKVEQPYQAVFLENDYLKVMLLPQLGGRIQRAYDKVKQRDFIYYNEVVKPALVGLLGPWISGGIEFNWPQHHRPTTFMPVDMTIEQNDEQSATIWLGEIEHMYGLQVMTGFRLYHDKALIEITSKIYNGNDTPRQFLWWANPAVKGGEQHQSIFPPDVTAVYDHGKRDVSDFPIATGTYYKVNYAPGTDISRYSNLPVPTSYMADHSDYDFVGAYCHDEHGGLLHVSDHHLSPGKKQWTWGNCGFGRAWDKNLTDHNGPYIELMTGVYTDNQPDFTWLDSHEEKHFVQNFLPYSDLDRVHNANTQIALKLSREHKGIAWGVYAVSAIHKAKLTITQNEITLFEQPIDLTPGQSQNGQIQPKKILTDALKITVTDGDGHIILSYLEHQGAKPAIPSPAKAPEKPENVPYVEQLYFIGQHLEQYHHATRDARNYYLEATQRDPYNYACNVALANLAYESANYDSTIEYADKALKRAHQLNKNPACGKASYIRACAKAKKGLDSQAFDDFYKSTWSGNCRDIGYFGAAQMAIKMQQYDYALELVNKGLQYNHSSLTAMALKARLLNILGQSQRCIQYCTEKLTHYPLAYLLAFEKYLASQSVADRSHFQSLTNQRIVSAIHLANFYLDINDKQLAKQIITLIGCELGGTLAFYQAYLSEEPNKLSQQQAEQQFNKQVLFANTLNEVEILQQFPNNAFACYLLGCFFYAKKDPHKGADFWQRALQLQADFAPVHRCMAIYYYNKCQSEDLALTQLQLAHKYAPKDARILFELDYLQKIIATSPALRLAQLEQSLPLVYQRDDLTAELLNLYNINNKLDKAAAIFKTRQFHPWEGGEGKVTGQYLIFHLRSALNQIIWGDLDGAIEYLNQALSYPDNLGEGRLVAQTDNDIHFWLAWCYHQQSKHASMKHHLNLATQGELDISQTRYYNDQPADYLFYKAAALELQGNGHEAREIFLKMSHWATEHLNEEVEPDFFAVSLPELIVFNNNLNKQNKVHCHFVQMMAQLGLMSLSLATEADFNQSLKKILELCPDHSKTLLFKEVKEVFKQFHYAIAS